MFKRLLPYIIPATGLLLVLVFWPTASAWAQDTLGNLATVADVTGLQAEDPRIIAARLIRSALLFLGVIAVCIVIYGGWIWMTSGGSEEQVTKAKRILVNGVIGLVIIMLSVAIVTFVMGAISRATGAGGGGGGGAGGGIGLGGGSASRFEVTGVAPTGAIPIRNVRVQITFSAPVDDETVEGRIKIVQIKGGEVVNGELSVQGNRLTFTPSEACPAPNEDRKCFAASTEFGVTVMDGIKSTAGRLLDCSNGKCISRFTTGELVDTANPEAVVTAPMDGSGVSQDAYVPVQTVVTDDAGVALAEFFVDEEFLDAIPAPAGGGLEAVLDALWDTSGRALGELVTLSSIGYDLAGNTASDAARVRVRGPWCFDGEITADKGETGVDCGGDSGAPEYCGACSGESCTASEDCGAGATCGADGRCVVQTRIDGYSPATGAPGTFVTLRGVGLGAGAEYAFQDAEGAWVPASIPACTAPTSTQVTIMVPAKAASGEIRVVGDLGEERTADDFGPRLVDFIVNDDVRPNLCVVQPESAVAPQAGLTYRGERFGATREESAAVFLPLGTAANSYDSWSAGEVRTTMPSLEDGTYRTGIRVDGLTSNELQVRVSRAATTNTPRIAEISPAPGSPGQYLTIFGSGFGGALGTVWFVNSTDGVKTAGVANFPSECEINQWTDGEIATVIPDDLALGAYTVYIERPDGAVSPAVTYEVAAGNPGPNVCALLPNYGLAGDEIRVIGGRFGKTPGRVTFTTERLAEIVEWEESGLTIRVPEGVASGPVGFTRADGSKGNERYFTVGGGEAGAAAPRTAAYAWTFSTGDVPAVPEVIHACTDTQLSAVPSSQYDGGTEVCLGAAVYVEFTVPMNEGTLDDALKLEKCTGSGLNRCGSTEAVAGRFTTLSQSVTFTPDVNLAPSSLYQVTVTTAAMSADGVTLERDDSWTFETSSTVAACVIETITLSAHETLLDSKLAVAPIVALPRAGCTPLDRDDYVYDWTLPKSFVQESGEAVTDQCGGSPSACIFAEALSEGTGPVTATERVTRVVGPGTVTVNYRDPYVTEYFPNCTEACRNGLVGARFNVPMNQQVLESGAYFERCENELCVERRRVSARARCTLDEAGKCVGFTFDYGLLAEGAFYRVTVPSRVVSESGAPLTRLNHADGFVFSFRTREDASVCRVERIGVAPATMITSQIGQRVLYSAEAYGAPDSCSVAGQRLEPMSYNWEWESPIDDENNDNNPATRVAAWVGEGRLDVMSAEGPMSGCSASCLSLGAEAYEAICGNGLVEVGEECEDGDVESGDGCSAACLREGTGAGGVCGDGQINKLPSGAGEDCDDGNLAAGDGCSPGCLAEGAKSVGSKCGNGDIARTVATGAGEECDDRNTASGDGCSSQCLNEGSPTLVDVSGAVCGNGVLEAPFEECDDDNGVSGDGCSRLCLYEGLAACQGEGGLNCCGNGGSVENFETCDDGNSQSGDGCSNRCLLEGASIAYASPSFCGDGVVGVGERAACEVSARGDSQVDPVQLAGITPKAPAEVDLQTQKAEATIRASVAGLTGEAALTLQCSARSDRDCVNPADNGLGAANCCMPRPEVSLSPSGSGVCRNAALVAIFDQEMDLSSVTAPGKNGAPARFHVLLDTASTGGVCPADHRTAMMGPLLATWWDGLRAMLGIEVAGAAGECYAPVGDIRQVPLEGGQYAVMINLRAALASNGAYTLVVEGDDAVLDDEISGVRALNGSALAATTRQTFTTGGTLCGLDEVVILDSDETPFFFGARDESHTLTADGYSYATGVRQQIQPITDVYDWQLGGWTTDLEDSVFETVEQQGGDQARVTALGQNGEGTVLASATITADSQSISAEDVIVGSAEISAFLCENPWPNPTLGEAFPWRDRDLNVAVSYCRDFGASGVEDDLPALSVVRSLASEVPGVVSIGGKPAEYLFRLPQSGDAIGLRFFENGTYLTPATWYKARGFSGSPKEVTVNDFSAVRDGRSTYIAVPNLDPGGDVYSNMALLSFNQDSGEELSEIYEQFLENVVFIRNVRGAALCEDQRGVVLTDESGSSVSCVSDFECAAVGGECGSNKHKMRRDLQRLLDVKTLQTAIEKYLTQNGTCSATTDRLCNQASDCPSGEVCMAIMPSLPAGTFVRGMASSSWSSWQEILGGALGQSLPIDPLNRYQGCGVDPYASYDAVSCVDFARGAYTCPAGSYAYTYRTTGQRQAELLVDLEYENGAWVSPIGGGESGLTIKVGNTAGATADGFTQPYCSGAVFGAEATCGDGIVGGGEACEPGQVGGSLTACDRDGDGTNDGFRAERCDTSCQFAEDTAGACIAPSCGDGVTGAGEECDDGVNNGAYGFCGADCRLDTRTYCGDGVLSGGELCDCGVAGITVPLGERRAFGGGLTCAGNNGAYTSYEGSSCAWDCRGPAAFCGNDVVDGAEECDGTAGLGESAYAGKICSGGLNRGEACTNHADCGAGSECGRAAADHACVIGETRSRTCDTSCSLEDWSACAPPAAHNGIVDPGEECDDGNEVDTDACTNDYKINVCGDGIINPAVEQCDLGAGNGGECTAEYGSTCSACSTACRLVIQSGDYCGDGERNGQEFCDAGDVPLRYVSVSQQVIGATCAVRGSTVVVDTHTQTCEVVGMCNGGVNNGNYCITGTTYCGVGITCEPPVCAGSCLSACPVTPQSTSLGLTPNLPGARAGSSVSLYSYEQGGTNLPNVATITIPACRVAPTLRADIRTSGITLPQNYVVFVTDTSGSMSGGLGAGKTRMSVTKETLEASVRQMYDELGEDVHIALVSYSTTATANPSSFQGPSGESTLTTAITAYAASGTTATHLGLDEAKRLLVGVPAGPTDNPHRKTIVLLTDGAANDPAAATASANAIKALGIELYTAGITSDTSFIGVLAALSSGQGYAYYGSTTEAIQGFYQQIIDRITGFALSLVSLAGTETVIGEDSGTVELPLPADFRCDPTRTQQIPLKPVFPGAGTLEIFNVRLDYCPSL